MKTNYEHLEEVNTLFEVIKTMLITGLSQRQVRKHLTTYTHSEIRNGKCVNGRFVVADEVVHDGEFLRLQNCPV